MGRAATNQAGQSELVSKLAADPCVEIFIKSLDFLIHYHTANPLSRPSSPLTTDIIVSYLHNG